MNSFNLKEFAITSILFIIVWAIITFVSSVIFDFANLYFQMTFVTFFEFAAIFYLAGIIAYIGLLILLSKVEI